MNTSEYSLPALNNWLMVHYALEPHHKVRDTLFAIRARRRQQLRDLEIAVKKEIAAKMCDLLNTNTVPLNGSAPSASRPSAARRSAPFRKSTGLVATSTRTPPDATITPLPSPSRLLKKSARNRSDATLESKRGSF
jgi:hypothetical protein